MAKGLCCANCGAIEFLHLIPQAVLISDYFEELVTSRGFRSTLLLCLKFEGPPEAPALWEQPQQANESAAA